MKPTSRVPWRALGPLVLLAAISSVAPLSLLPAGLGAALHSGQLIARPVLFVLLVICWLVIERSWSMTRASKSVADMADIFHRLRRSDISGARQICERHDIALARIVLVGLDSMENAARMPRAWELMEGQTAREAAAVNRPLRLLKVLGIVATMLGTLGMLFAFVSTFTNEAARAAPRQSIEFGPLDAMYCSALVLVTAIYAAIGHEVLNGRSRSMVATLRQEALRAFHLLRETRLDHPQLHPCGLTCSGRTLGTLGLYAMDSPGRWTKMATLGRIGNLLALVMVGMMMVLAAHLLPLFHPVGYHHFPTWLPYAHTTQALPRAGSVITVRLGVPGLHEGVVTFDGIEVASLPELLQDWNPDWKIPVLTEQLELKKHNWKVLHPDRPFPNELIILMDKDVPFRALKKIMYSAGLAGFFDLSLAVATPVKS